MCQLDSEHVDGVTKADAFGGAGRSKGTGQSTMWSKLEARRRRGDASSHLRGQQGTCSLPAY